MFLRPITIVRLACSVCALDGAALATGGTTQVASEGESAYVSPGWPQRTGELVNHPLRTSGWNAWFSPSTKCSPVARTV